MSDADHHDLAPRMTVLVLGARGAVGAAAVAALRARRHEVVTAGRAAPTGGLAIDPTTPAGRERLAFEAQRVDVVLDATGLETGDVQAAIGATPLVDVSATAAHLDRLAARVHPDGVVVRGVGIAPGLSTVFVAALDAEPGDDVDVAVLLGAGEQHGAAAVAWTARLAGAPVHAAPESRRVANLRSWRRLPAVTGPARAFLRADFPDDALIGRPRGIAVRSWLALDSRVATAALAFVGAAPPLAPLLRHAPHIGGDAWRVTVRHRSSGRLLEATGAGQSVATGRLAALAMEQVVVRGRPAPTGTALTMADLVSMDDLVAAGGIVISRRG